MNLLEQIIHNKINKFSSLCYVGDNQIVKKYGNNSFGIDHLLIFDEYIITIQDKWEITSPNIRDIRHFIGGTNYLSNELNKKILLGIFASKKSMTKRGKEIFREENDKHVSDVFFDLNNNESEDKLSDIVFDFIKSYLTQYGLFDFNSTINKFEKWTLFKHQIDAINSFNNFLNNNIKNGIISCPTGAGKTIIALSIIGEYWKRYKKSVLWITERKDVLQSQFDNKHKLNCCIESGFIPDYSHFNMITWYNKKSDIEYLNKELLNEKPIFLIVNVDSIIYDERYKNIDKNNFGLIILDECHSAGAQCTYDMLDFFQESWHNLNCLIGFSATPIRPETTKFKKICNLFGDGNNVNFLSRMTLIDAIDEGIIVPPEFHWIETELDKKISYSEFSKNVNENNYLDIIKYIDEMFSKSVTKKGIAWTQTIENADEWKKILDTCKENKSKYPNLNKIKIFISHTGKSIIEDNDLNKFVVYNKPCLLICVGRCREGFDDPKIDLGINLDAVQNRGMIVFIQETGRTLRLYGEKERGIMMDTFTFIDEEMKIEQIANIIVGYSLFLKQLDINSDKIDISKEYNTLLNSLKSNGNKIVLKTPKDKEIIFNITSSKLKSVDWNNLPKTLIEKINKEFYKNGISYEMAKKIILETNPKLMSKEEYFELCNKDERLPKEPEFAFKGIFKGWINYLSIERIYYDLETCKNKVYEYLINIENIDLELTNLTKNLKRIDDNFPSYDLWCDYYNINDLSEIFILNHYDELVNF
jgi:superfamily II DNA or RNA helicase